MSLQADYVIVGGGIAGCVLASRIKQANSTASVLLFEAGPDPTEKNDMITPFGGFALAKTELDWDYKTAPNPHTDGRIFTLSAGRTLGGGSSLNYGGWMRGGKNDYDEWARIAGDKKWSYEGLLPFFIRTENCSDLSVDKSQHGFKGPIKVTSVKDSDPHRRYPLSEKVEKGWAELGVKRLPESNSGNLEGLSECIETWIGGKRQPAHLAYPLKDVQVVTHCPVYKVLFSNAATRGTAKATGVLLTNGREVKAHKEVVVASGVFSSPTLLLRSGLGPSSMLKQHHIPLIHDIPGVGANYVEHFCFYQTWKLKDPSRGLALGHPSLTNPAFFKGLPMDLIPYDRPPRELMEKALDEDGVTGDQRKSLLQRTFMETFVVYTAMAPGIPHDGSCITTLLTMTCPTSQGKIILPPPSDPETASSTASSHPEVTESLDAPYTIDPPLIEPNYLSTAFDKAIFTWGTRRLLQLLFETDALADYIECEMAPPGVKALEISSTDADIEQRLIKTGMTQYHGVGTCALGDVVDAELKVKGTDNLRVCDASVIPVQIGGHPMATVYAVAERGAAFINGET